jgi:hypothetical protein
MNRYWNLLYIYKNLDTVYAFMILLGVWVAGFGHILDWGTKSKLIVSLFWGLAMIGFAAGLIFIGLTFSD